MNTPKVSIIIPCYNSEKWIEECISSALNQTYKNIEVIVVDNESTDNSVNIIKKIQEQHKNIVFSTAKNIYPNCWDEAREEGFRLMTGDYVLTMGSDDFLDQKFIQNCMKIFMQAPDKIKALQSPAKGVTVKNSTKIFTGELKHVYSSKDEFKSLCLKRCPVNTPTVIYSTALYKQNLLKTEPEKYGGAADYNLYCKLIDNNIFIYPCPVWLGFYYRWHEDQATWKVHKEGINYDKMIQDYWRAKWKTQA
jgi:glycosyltransferase involved in cell wall biosynthesis